MLGRQPDSGDATHGLHHTLIVNFVYVDAGSTVAGNANSFAAEPCGIKVIRDSGGLAAARRDDFAESVALPGSYPIRPAACLPSVSDGTTSALAARATRSCPWGDAAFVLAPGQILGEIPAVAEWRPTPGVVQCLFRWLWVCASAMGVGAVWAQQTELVVRIPRPESMSDTRNAYFIELLELALTKTRNTDGPFRLQFSELNMLIQGRGMELLKRGELIDVIHTMTSIERERELLPVRIPLLKGLLGYRVFLIRKGDEARFAAVRTQEDLQALTAGQGLRWPDVGILEANGIRVMVGRSYEGLFEMLRRGRFDYFPRGVTEAWEEAQLHAGQDLVVEQTLMLVYPTAIYYFVNPRNAGLANRIERGLRMALADGSFDRLFDRYYGRMIEQTRMHERRVIRLSNPLLPPETPVSETKLWHHIRD